MRSVNTENWTYCRYQSGSFLAMVTFGADPENLKDDNFDYYVTVLENEELEVYQERFQTLSEACLFLNKQYGDWSFQDQTVAKEGCSTCAAH